MAYENFENTPFDLNGDGHIDSNEAAFIYDTFYGEEKETSNSTNNDDDDDGGSGYYISKEEKRREGMRKS